MIEVTTTRPPFLVGYRRRSNFKQKNETTSTTTTSPKSTSSNSKRRTIGPQRATVTTNNLESPDQSRSRTRPISQYRFRTKQNRIKDAKPTSINDQSLDSTNKKDETNIRTATRRPTSVLSPQRRRPTTTRKPQSTRTTTTTPPSSRPVRINEFASGFNNITVALKTPFSRYTYLESGNNRHYLNSLPQTILNYNTGVSRPYFRTTTRNNYVTPPNQPITTSYTTQRPQPFNRINSKFYYSPEVYDYPDSIDARVTEQIPEHSKVLLHSDGHIECLDQGIFPHPVSCKKFIQCAKTDNSRIIGYEHTCSKNLIFDPIGGMCNWSSGLDCNNLIT